MSLAAYIAKCKEWEKIYGVPNRAFRFDPTEITTSCVKCGKLRRKMNRHHICSDFLFAHLRPDLYAKQYLEFRKEDCAKLCGHCHISIERYYEPIKDRIYVERMKGAETTEAWCEKWRAKFREAFEKWLKTPIRKKRKKKRHK